MTVSFEQALEVARDRYPHLINQYEEYRDYFVFWHEDGVEHFRGSTSPIVI